MAALEPKYHDRALFLRRLILAELLARRGEGPLARRPPLRVPKAASEPKHKEPEPP